MNVLTDLVVIKDVQPGCPLCGTFSLPRLGGSCSTMLGWSGDGTDPNHVSTEAHCRSCNGDFVIERKDGRVWHTKEGRVLAGQPHCFERYIYTCKNCGADVTREHRQLDGQAKATALYYVGGKPQHRTFYCCAGCKREIELQDEW